MLCLKRFLLLGIVLLNCPQFSYSQSFYANVSNDTVSLVETQCWRNCGSMYTAVVTLDGYTLNWCQVDTGATATCYCVFDLSVTYGPLEPGDYTANFYYTDAWSPSDTIYEGSVDFTINSGKSLALGGGIISTFQSDCYSGQGIGDSKMNRGFNIYPLPVRSGQAIHFEANGIIEDAFLEIYSIAGQKIFSREYKAGNDISDQWRKEELFPGPGMYLARIRAGRSSSTRLIPVL